MNPRTLSEQSEINDIPADRQELSKSGDGEALEDDVTLSAAGIGKEGTLYLTIAEPEPEEPAEPDVPAEKFEKCTSLVTGFCTVYNSVRNTPVINIIFSIIHEILHAIKDFI